MSDQCSIGKLLSENCDLNSSLIEPQALKDLSNDELTALYLKVQGLTRNEEEMICNKHYNSYVQFYTLRQKNCCDPFKKHRRNISQNLSVINLQFSISATKASEINIIPGKKLCKTCYISLSKTIQVYNERLMFCANPFQRPHRNKADTNLVDVEESLVHYLSDIHKIKLLSEQKLCRTCYLKINSEKNEYEERVSAASTFECDPTTNNTVSRSLSDTPEEVQSTENSEYMTNSQSKRKVDAILDIVGIPPFKRQKLNDTRMADKATDILETALSSISKALEETYDIVLPKYDNLTKIQKQSCWFEDMLKDIQTKYNSASTIEEKISLLSLLPAEWSLGNVEKYFDCSYYMLRQARKVKEQNGILTSRIRKTYNKFGKEIRDEIISFYLDEANSRTCSGMKEVRMEKVPGQKSIPKPKRLLMYNLSDLYHQWIKETNHEEVPCFAFFADLRPKECVLAGEPGTHMICVCLQHQNVKLKLAAIHPRKNYREVIEKSVCSVNNKDCMLHNCQNCPKKSEIDTILKGDLSSNIKNVTYKNWVNESVKSKNSDTLSSSKTNLKTFEIDLLTFIKDLEHDIYDLHEHHFITEKQKEEFKMSKINLDNITGLMVSDFAENYPFIVQDSTQGYYFNNTHASLYTAIFFYRLENEIKCISFCIISSSRKHQAYSVHIYNESILNEIKQLCPWIKIMKYFSDGAPTQFKNKNHFVNLCHHEEDYGLKIASHNFFTTSHGKTACDGIGAVAKCAARRASLHNVQITNSEEMYDYLSKNVKGIRFVWVSENDILKRGQKLSKRFETAKTIPNTRQYHYFEPLNEFTMRVKLFSSDSEFEIVRIS